MPRDSNGNYTLPAGNPVVTATPVSSTWANNTLNDVATALTGSLSRSGDGSMLGPLELDSGTVGAPGLSFAAETGLGLYRSSAGVLAMANGGTIMAYFAQSSAYLAGQLDLGHASDTTLSRLSAGTVGVEGVALARIDTNFTISGVWTFSGRSIHSASSNAVANGWSLNINNNNPGILLYDADALADEKVWEIRISDGDFIISSWNDAYGSQVVPMAIRKSGAALADWVFNGTAFAFNGTLSTTGAIELGHASDTTLARIAAGRVSVEGKELANLSDNQVFAGFAQFPTIELGHASDTTLSRSAAGILAVEGVDVGTRDAIRRTSGFARGEVLAISAGVTLNTSDMATSRIFSIYNDSASPITITQGAGVTLRLSGTATTGNRTMAQRTFATIWCNSGTEAVMGGSGVT